VSVRALALLAALATGAAGAAERHVDPAHPNASERGEGAAAQPYRTLVQAMAALRPGDTLVIASGVYRESLEFPPAPWASAAARTTIRAAPGAVVVIKGSDVVTGWERLRADLYVKQPWPVEPQQVFVDGVALRQIGGTIFTGYPEKPDHPMRALHASQKGIWPGRRPGSVRDMSDASFFYDREAATLYVKGDFGAMHGHLVEVSVRPFLVRGRGLHGVTLERLSSRSRARSGSKAISCCLIASR
jgi:hypothetical protein